MSSISRHGSPVYRLDFVEIFARCAILIISGSSSMILFLSLIYGMIWFFHYRILPELQFQDDQLKH